MEWKIQDKNLICSGEKKNVKMASLVCLTGFDGLQRQVDVGEGNTVAGVGGRDAEVGNQEAVGKPRLDGRGGRGRGGDGGRGVGGAAAAGLLQIPQADFGLRLVFVPVCQATPDAL